MIHGLESTASEWTWSGRCSSPKCMPRPAAAIVAYSRHPARKLRLPATPISWIAFIVLSPPAEWHKLHLNSARYNALRVRP